MGELSAQLTGAISSFPVLARRLAPAHVHLEAGMATSFESQVGLFAAASSLAVWRWPLATSAPPTAPYSRTRALPPPPPLARRSLAGCLVAPAWSQVRRKHRCLLSE